MLLVLMRHGIAEDTTPDESRRLTVKGRKRAREVAQLLARFDIRPDLLVTSTRVRARQTLEIAAAALRADFSRIEVSHVVDFSTPWLEFAAEMNHRVRDLPEDATILVAGHQPQFGRLLAAALTGVESDMEFRKAAVAGIRFDGPIAAGQGDLEFHLTPALARAWRD